MTEGKYTGAGGLQRGRAVTCQEFSWGSNREFGVHSACAKAAWGCVYRCDSGALLHRVVNFCPTLALLGIQSFAVRQGRLWGGVATPPAASAQSDYALKDRRV